MFENTERDYGARSRPADQCGAKIEAMQDSLGAAFVAHCGLWVDALCG